MALMTLRTSRQVIIPLWADAMGLSASTISLLYALSMAFDVALFFPGGAIMDRFGRWWVCVPSMFVMSLCLAALPLTTTTTAIAILASILGIGNGVSSGIVLTLGADASPSFGRAQFLAGWRMMSDAGQTTGPLVISGMTALVGRRCGDRRRLGIIGGFWLARWVPRTPEQLEAFRPDD